MPAREPTRWSHAAGNGVVPSHWQVTVVAFLPALVAPGARMATAVEAKLTLPPTPPTVEAMSMGDYGRVLVQPPSMAATAFGESAADASSPLYEFSGDADGKFGCSTEPLVTGYDPLSGFEIRARCTGAAPVGSPAGATVEWPPLLTFAPPVAGRAVDKALLGTVERPLFLGTPPPSDRSGILVQVTYGGHPLYTLGPPLEPQGEDDMETVAPLYPWHGIWYLVSAKNGQPVPGRATIGTGRLQDRKIVLTAEVDDPYIGLHAARAVVYTLSGTTKPGACTGAGAVKWIPVLTTGAPGAANGVSPKDLGVVQRADGTDQVTYQGRPLYLYSLEKFTVASSQLLGRIMTGTLVMTGTAGNGNGLAGPGGGTFSVIPIA